MSRSTRFFEIIQILRQADVPITAQQIADMLEVTKRTIYRDIASLQASRLPIEGEAGVGYVMRSGFDLPPLTFDPDELEAIMVGLALLGRTGDRGLEHAARRAIFKISDVLPENVDHDVPLHVSTWNRIPRANIELGTLRHFIREEAELEIEYLDLCEQRSIRKIQPFALVYYIDAVLLAAWCELRQAFRHFRVDRIQKCAATGDRFTGDGGKLRVAWEQEGLAPQKRTS
jgi:predicted DNA-binding transcriptional regulator YafY